MGAHFSQEGDFTPIEAVLLALYAADHSGPPDQWRGQRALAVHTHDLNFFSMFLDAPRVSRVLSAFDHANLRWAAIPLLDQHVPITQGLSPSRPPKSHPVRRQSLSITSWNIDASPFWNVERSKLILAHILEGPKCPDILHLQEVTSSVRRSLLSDPRVRSSFLTTDAEDETAFKGVPFATMTLLSNKRFSSSITTEEDKDDKMGLDSVFRMPLPSRYGRDALCVDIRHPNAPGSVLRLLNVLMESRDAHFRRELQLYAMNALLREAGCKGGVIGGDFNAIHEDDYTLVERYGLVDAWAALRGEHDGGATWRVGVELEEEQKPGRLDKVVMLGVQPREIEVLRPGFINAHTPWSSHCGLHCTFTICQQPYPHADSVTVYKMLLQAPTRCHRARALSRCDS